MIKIDFPPHAFKIKESPSGKELIFDEIRKRWLSLTPEEWVRQNIIQYLIKKLHYPASLMAIEREIKLGELRKRCDIVLYKNNNAWMIIECKEPNVPITEKTLHQILRYHLALPAPFLCLSNGNTNFIFQRAADDFVEIKDFPVYEDGA